MRAASLSALTSPQRCTLVLYVGANALLQRAKNLVLPKNPLDDLIDRLGGPSKVREQGGRRTSQVGDCTLWASQWLLKASHSLAACLRQA